MKRVVVSGYGVITPFGDVEHTWNGIIQGEKTLNIENKEVYSKLGNELFEKSEFNKKHKQLDPLHCLGLEVSKQALKMANLNDSTSPEDIGVIMGSMYCSMRSVEKVIGSYYEREFNRIYPSIALQITNNALSGQIAIEYQLKGPNLTVSTACSSSAQAISLGTDYIKLDKAKVMLVGGVDLTPQKTGVYQAYDRLKVLVNDDFPRPFSKNRSGFAIGEGGGALVLEEYEHAIQRGAKIYGEILGTASTCDAYTMAIPDTSGKMIAKTMVKAIKNADLHINNIDYINAHATGTKVGDLTETIAIKKVFGSRANNLYISSIKGSIGHTIGAAGAIEAIITLLALNKGTIPPTLNYIGEDDGCDLNYIPNTNIHREISIAMSNSFGFGGNNVSLVIGKV